MIILDTNVISELLRRSPNDVVARWVLGQSTNDLRITSITIAEILYGIERLPNGTRRDELMSLAKRTVQQFASQILPFDNDSAAHYATIRAARESLGIPISGFDAQIAAICLNNKAQLATRNEKDFVNLGVSIINPWKGDVRDL